MKEGITLKQTDEAKLERSREILEALKEARGGKLLDSHRVMGNDPNLINMFYQQYVNCNKKDISIPKKYRELIGSRNCNLHRDHYESPWKTGSGKRRYH